MATREEAVVSHVCESLTAFGSSLALRRRGWRARLRLLWKGTSKSTSLAAAPCDTGSHTWNSSCPVQEGVWSAVEELKNRIVDVE